MLSLEGGFIAGPSWYAPSLLDPMDGGVQNRPAAELRQLLQSGRGGADRTSGPMAEVVRHSLQQWTVQDIDAMVAYLQSLPKAAATSSISQATPRRTAAHATDGLSAFCGGRCGPGKQQTTTRTDAPGARQRRLRALSAAAARCRWYEVCDMLRFFFM